MKTNYQFFDRSLQTSQKDSLEWPESWKQDDSCLYRIDRSNPVKKQSTLKWKKKHFSYTDKT